MHSRITASLRCSLCEGQLRYLPSPFDRYLCVDCAVSWSTSDSEGLREDPTLAAAPPAVRDEQTDTSAPQERHTMQRIIDPSQTVQQILPGSVLSQRGEPVLATAVLIAMLEDATWAALAPHTAPEIALLGRGGHYEHTAPAFPGQTLRIEVMRTRRGTRQQSWTAHAFNLDSQQHTGQLHHDVVTLDRTRFYRRHMIGAGDDEHPTGSRRQE